MYSENKTEATLLIQLLIMYAICCYAAELTQSSALALILQSLLYRKLPA